jgi:hypothetical protein
MKITSFFQSPAARLLLLALMGCVTAIAFGISGSINTATESGVIMELPGRVGSFIGKDAEASEGEKHVLPSDTGFVKKIYQDPMGNVINAQIVLAGAEKRSIHRPELCLPAQGWSINRRESIPIMLTDGRSISVMNDSISRMIETSPGVTRPLDTFYCYWFVGSGVTTSSHLIRLFLTSWDRVVHHKNHRWAYVAVSAPVLEGLTPNGKSAEETLRMISGFISDLAPAVMKK